MEHNKCDHKCTISSATSSVCQTLSEMDWEKGLWYAAYYGDNERVEHLINKSKSVKEAVNAPDNSGYTALHYAARKGYTNICKILLQNGAQIDAETKAGKAAPLHKAAAAGNIATTMFLIQSGATVEKQDVDGQTALHKAIENKHLDLVNILVEACPKLKTIKDNKGK